MVKVQRLNTHSLDTDRRIVRTRRALLAALNELVLSQSYASIRVEDILRRAGIGRSTFYQHFDGKDDLLTQAMSGLLDVLADSVETNANPRLMEILEHFWENRRFAGAILSGDAGALVHERLRLRMLERLSTRLPLGEARIRARAVSSGQLAVLRAWLTGAEPATVEQLEKELRLLGG